MRKERTRVVYAVIVIVLILIALLSCEPANVPSKRTKNYIDMGIEIQEFELENCQYLYLYSGSIAALTHKGNCTNHE